jgi:predicted oxidoreductase
MKKYQIPNTDLEVSRIGYGCMGLGRGWSRDPLTDADRKLAVTMVTTALEQGINFFDHADIYAFGKAETVFGDVLEQAPEIREQIIIQTKCGIRFPDEPEPGVPGRYDFSYEHITRSVDGSLQRLRCGHIDLLLLHRPDPLVEPDEVARAFDELQQTGKVRYFGVSNHSWSQLELLKKSVNQPLVVNQLELNPLHSGLINESVIVNQRGHQYTAAAGTLDYCRLHDILVQAWAPVAKGHLVNPPEDAEPRVKEAAAVVARLAEEKGTTREAIVLAWLLRHPAGIQPILGTTKRERLLASCEADSISLSREEWHMLFVAGRGAPIA